MRKSALCFETPPRWPALWLVKGERIRVIGRWHFLVKSKSEDGWHCVDLEYVSIDWPDGGCTCRSYDTRRDCRHIRVIRQYLGLPLPS